MNWRVISVMSVMMASAVLLALGHNDLIYGLFLAAGGALLGYDFLKNHK